MAKEVLHQVNAHINETGAICEKRWNEANKWLSKGRQVQAGFGVGHFHLGTIKMNKGIHRIKQSLIKGLPIKVRIFDFNLLCHKVPVSTTTSVASHRRCKPMNSQVTLQNFLMTHVSGQRPSGMFYIVIALGTIVRSLPVT